MVRRFLLPLSLTHQVAMLMLLLGLLGIAGMTISSWMSQSIQGNAHVINKAGSLRMQSYRLLAMLPLSNSSPIYLDDLERDEANSDLQQAVRREGLTEPFSTLRTFWQTQLRPQLQQAQHPNEAAQEVAAFVSQLDALMSAIDHSTEERIALVTKIQRLFIAPMGMVLLATILYLRHRLLTPLRKLVAMAHAIGHGDFSERVSLSGKDEMSTLAQALNSMSDELSAIYHQLVQRVAEQTTRLRQKNDTLSFLYRASRRLHTNAPLCSRVMPILDELPALTPLNNIQLRLYQSNNQEQFHQVSHEIPYDAASCPDANCQSCGLYTSTAISGGEPVFWALHDQHHQYGMVLATRPAESELTPDQQQLLNTLLGQFTSTLALERQSEHQQQLILMEERAAIARELHDSLAQSLSCLKIHVSCIQMQGVDLSDEVHHQLNDMREELNTAYRHCASC